MKKFYSSALAILTILLMFSATACSSNKLADSFSEQDVRTKAEEVVGVINTLDYDKMVALFRTDLQSDITADQFKQSWDATLKGAGAFKEFSSESIVGQKDKTTGEDYAVAILFCKYEKAQLTFTISLDTNLEVVGMYMK